MIDTFRYQLGTLRANRPAGHRSGQGVLVKLQPMHCDAFSHSKFPNLSCYLPQYLALPSQAITMVMVLCFCWHTLWERMHAP